MYMYVYVFEAKFERRNHRFEFSEKPWNVNILFFKTITTREIMSKKKKLSKISRNIWKKMCISKQNSERKPSIYV